MADEKTWKGGRLGQFGISRRIDGVGAGLGRLYEAHHVITGAPAVVLVPSRGLGWDLRESWQVRIFFHESPPYIALQVERAPGSGTLPELSLLLDLITSVIERVEKNVRLREHLMSQPVGRVKLYWGRARRLLRSWRWRAAEGLALVTLGVGLWLLVSGAGSGKRTSHGLAHEALSQADAPTLVDEARPTGAVIAYPLPDKPFRNQAKAPCKPESEVEINGGCWVTLERRPPCASDQAEYKGKCYLPMSLDRGHREPRSIQP